MIAYKPRLEFTTERHAELVVHFRRLLHQFPETAYQEFKTQALVLEELKKLGVRAKKMGGTGVKGIVPGARKPGNIKAIMLRADMDALPVREETDLPFKSKHEGKMHACGHDAHVAILLTVARLLIESPVNGPVVLCFQPAEEGGVGAQKMIDDGVLENPKVGMAIGIHVWAEMPFGNMGIIYGPCMAAVDEFELKVKGVGGHAAYPHRSIDPVFISAQIVTALQSIVSRNVSPLDTAVVTVAGIQAGTAFNIIPAEVIMKGTCRTFNKDTRKLVEKRFRDIVTGVAKSLGGSVEILYKHQVPATINSPEACDLLWKVSESVLGKTHVIEPKPTMGGEDMSLYLQKVPGCFGFLGMKNPEKGVIWPHHHPKFTLDEDILPIGVEIMYRAAKEYYEKV